MADIEVSVILALLGAVIGFAGKAVYDDFAMPRLVLQTDTYSVTLPNFTIQNDLLGIGTAESGYTPVTLLAYRARVSNRQRRLMNAAAENCIAWIDVDGMHEPLQVNWIGGTAVNINVGDYRDFNFSGLAVGYPVVFAPTEIEYTHRPRVLGQETVNGTLRVTSSNARTASQRFTVTVTESRNELDIRFQ